MNTAPNPETATQRPPCSTCGGTGIETRAGCVCGRCTRTCRACVHRGKHRMIDRLNAGVAVEVPVTLATVLAAGAHE